MGCKTLKEKILRWELENFNLELKSVWSFPERGNWATHDNSWRGNWSPYIPRNVILRYSKMYDIVLDQFAGGGTTLIESKLLGRNIIGVDINENALRMCKEKTTFYSKIPTFVKVLKGDARNLHFIKDRSIDLICTHPPYANIIRYSKDLKNDLSNMTVEVYLKQMEFVAQECYRVLKENKYCAILVGDIRKNGFVQPLGYSIMNIFLKKGFTLKEIIIKEQHNCRKTESWIEKSLKYNFLLLSHEYLFIFKKMY